jgi:hypothetical protein
VSKKTNAQKARASQLRREVQQLQERIATDPNPFLQSMVDQKMQRITEYTKARVITTLQISQQPNILTFRAG